MFNHARLNDTLIDTVVGALMMDNHAKKWIRMLHNGCSIRVQLFFRLRGWASLVIGDNHDCWFNKVNKLVDERDTNQQSATGISPPFILQ